MKKIFFLILSAANNTITRDYKPIQNKISLCTKCCNCFPNLFKSKKQKELEKSKAEMEDFLTQRLTIDEEIKKSEEINLKIFDFITNPKKEKEEIKKMQKLLKSKKENEVFLYYMNEIIQNYNKNKTIELENKIKACIKIYDWAFLEKNEAFETNFYLQNEKIINIETLEIN